MLQIIRANFPLRLKALKVRCGSSFIDQVRRSGRKSREAIVDPKITRRKSRSARMAGLSYSRAFEILRPSGFDPQAGRALVRRHDLEDSPRPFLSVGIGRAAYPCRLPALRIRLLRRPVSDARRAKDAPAGFAESCNGRVSDFGCFLSSFTAVYLFHYLRMVLQAVHQNSGHEFAAGRPRDFVILSAGIYEGALEQGVQSQRV
jgi:hypothetical protein